MKSDNSKFLRMVRGDFLALLRNARLRAEAPLYADCCLARDLDLLGGLLGEW